MADDTRPDTRSDGAPTPEPDGVAKAAPDMGAEADTPDLDPSDSGPSVSGPDLKAETPPEPATEAEPEVNPDDTPDTPTEAEVDMAVEAEQDGSGPDPETDPETDPATDLAQDPEPPAPNPERERPACTVGLFGKLPARGDFITRNIPHALQRPFEDWLIPLMQETRDLLGADWTATWRGAVPWRFWIGPDVLAGSWQRDLTAAQGSAAQTGGAISGVMLPSADRHGRDFPLVLVLADGVARLLPPPVITPPDHGWYALCDRFLYSARTAETLEPVLEALATLPGPLLPPEAEVIAPLLERRALWAPGDGGDRIWADIASADHHLAASARSYWWNNPHPSPNTSPIPGTPDSACVLSFAGLPDAQSFAFMLARNGAA